MHFQQGPRERTVVDFKQRVTGLHICRFKLRKAVYVLEAGVRTTGRPEVVEGQSDSASEQEEGEAAQHQGF